MAGRSHPLGGNPPYRPYGGPSSPGIPNRDLKKIIGGSMMLVGSLFALYGAGKGLSKLVSVALDNFGLLCVAGTINFIFWTILFFPVGGFVANGLCGACAFTFFGGIPAIPGILIAAGGAFVYFNA
ncbi:MAG: hypothetical protein JSS10_02325 [Verrucomicrobia bacterium]|nr:hypothetical protein [Verrucomicrobiota bacterium]